MDPVLTDSLALQLSGCRAGLPATGKPNWKDTMTSTEILTELRTKLARARELIDTAFNRGTISRELRDQYTEELTPDADRSTPVTITLNLTGADNLTRHNLTAQVDRVLAELARRGGATVVPGSVRVNLNGAPAAAPTVDEDEVDEEDFDEGEGGEGTDGGFADDGGSEAGGNPRQVAISLELTTPDAVRIAGNWSARQQVQSTLVGLGRRFGVAVRDVQLTSLGESRLGITVGTDRSLSDVGGHPARINQEVEHSLAGLARGNGFEIRSGSVRVT